MEADPTKRFSDRVDNYVKYRPSYPPEVLDYLETACDLNTAAVIADVGAGTGIFTKLLVDKGYKVFAVEPNQPMLNAAIEQLSGKQNFTPVDGTAGGTTLPDHSIDMIICAQAFHWFSNDSTRMEFNRILKSGGKTALIWNNRATNADPFSVEYDALLRNDSVDYNKVNHQNIKDLDFKVFFKDGKYEVKKFPNAQVFNEEGLIGRAFSSSYVPPQGTDEGNKFLKLLRELFAKYNDNGKITFHYQTEIYLGEV
ncbi:MAG: class I SAM-dependent methyltransferase [Sphingobacteriales bacterium]